jgi:chromosomal replication initiation ATPase DnaA
MLPPPKPEEQPQPPAAPSLATKNLPSLEEICNEISRLQEELRELRKTKKDKEQPHHRRKIWDLMNPGLEPKTMAAIIEEVCRKWGYTITDMRSARRDKRIVVARHELFWRCRHETYRSLSEIGRFLNKDHTTVLHGISRYEKLRNAIRDGTFDNEHGSGVLKDVKGLFL